MSSLKLILVGVVGAVIGGVAVYFYLGYKKPTVTEDESSPKQMMQALQEQQKQLMPQMQDQQRQLMEEMQQQQQQFSEQLDSMFDEDFFGQEDPFEAMRQFRDQMQKDFEDLEGPSGGSPFDVWFGQKFGGGSVYDISQREDEEHIYYDVIVENAQGTSVTTNIENGILTITGKVEMGPNDEDSQLNTYSSSFSRSFPLPPHVNPDGMKMMTEDNKIIIQFPKTEGA